MVNLQRNAKEATGILRYIRYIEFILTSSFQSDNTHCWTDCRVIGTFRGGSRNECNLLESNLAIELRAHDY